MKKIFYSLIWYFMQMPWPVRFLFELMIYVIGINFLIRLFNLVGNKLTLKRQFGKIYVYIGTTIAAAIGRKQSWGKTLDDKIITKGQKYGSEPMNFHLMSYKIVWIAIIVCYLFSIIPDTGAFKYFDGKVAECFLNSKAFFVQKEEQWTAGYQIYEPESKKEAIAAIQQSKSVSKSDIEIKVNKGKAKQKICIYQKPISKAKILLKFEGKGKIIYKNKIIKKEKKIYWVKVYVPSKKITGWMKHSYIQKSVWKKIKDK